MNCVVWETRIALHSGGDLTGAEAAEVERHLGECPGCRLFWSELRESLAVLRAAHADIPAPAHFAAVRSRVMAELQRTARPWLRLAWIAAGAAVVAALLLVALRPSPVVPEVPRLLASIPPAPLRTAAPSPAPPPPVRRLVAASAPRRAPLTIKLQTQDPNIVIYWTAD